MLAPMPLAAALDLTPMPLDIVAPVALGLGGNAVTVSFALWEEMACCDPGSEFDPQAVGLALKRAIGKRQETGAPRMAFAVVHPHSSHNYDLRYWLAACGIDPDRDIDIVIVPPPLMGDALSKGKIDGYCVGEPWNTAGVMNRAGIIATTKSRIWRSSPEKVLGVAADYAKAHPGVVDRLVRAIVQAAKWCQNFDNRKDLAALLAAWGPCPAGCQNGCTGDLDGDCMVGPGDLAILLAGWGDCD